MAGGSSREGGLAETLGRPSRKGARGSLPRIAGPGTISRRGTGVNHQEQRAEKKQHDREERHRHQRAAEAQHEHHIATGPRPVRPMWFAALGLLLATVALLRWMAFL